MLLGLKTGTFTQGAMEQWATPLTLGQEAVGSNPKEVKDYIEVFQAFWT